MPILLANFVVRALNSTPDSCSGGEPTDQRNLWDILWSCIVTIFACTWIAIHPNIPAADDSLIVVSFRRASLMLCGVVAPEIIILWAMRQWYSARRIGQTHKDKGWTTTHGFFIQMGGFMVHNGRQPPYPILINELEAKYVTGEIDWPQITEIEIQDRSKGDALSKGLVILQTSWFLMQCIGRQYMHLTITELELITLAFAALNIITYFFWWNKPLDIKCPYPIYLNQNPDISDDASKSVTGSKKYLGFLSRLATSLRHFLRVFGAGLIGSMPPIKAIVKNKGARLLFITVYIQRPASLLLKFLLKGALAIKGYYDDEKVQGRVPTFYAAQLDPNSTLFFIMTLLCAFIGCAFGGIHCIAWYFQFASQRDQSLWRISSLVITCVPFPIALLSYDMSHMEDDILMRTIGNTPVLDTTSDYTNPSRSQHPNNEEIATPSHAQYQSANEIDIEDSVGNMVPENQMTVQPFDIPLPPIAILPVGRTSCEPRIMECQAGISPDLMSHRSSTYSRSNIARGNHPLSPVDTFDTYSSEPFNIRLNPHAPSWRYSILMSGWGIVKSLCHNLYRLYEKLLYRTLPGRRTLRLWCQHQWYTLLSYWILPCNYIIKRWTSSIMGILLGTAHFQHGHFFTWRYFLMAFIWAIKCLLLAGLVSVYVVARFILIIQALKQLKNLPPEALQTMEWTSFIPHV